MRILELFAGTGSVGKVFGADGWEVISLDINPKANATIHADIRTWDYTIFETGHFDVVWASPVCTQYSRARTTAHTPRDLVWADSLVLRALEIIEYLKPKFWFLENPQTGLLKTRPFMLNLPYTDVDYCRYSEWGYKKRTRIGLIAAIRGNFVWALGVVLQWRGDGTERARNDGL
jgi:site-specific DNA-cytosine methylase